MKKLLRPLYVPIISLCFKLFAFCVKYSSLLYANIIPYKFEKLKYRETFLCHDSDMDDSRLKDIPRVVWCFWTGDNDLTENRKRSIKQLQATIGIQLNLVTPDNLDQYIIPQHPLHPAYKHLSYVHRSDYLRCYFAHHYGGGYIDIKECTGSWNKVFDILSNSDNYILGYPEQDPAGVCIDSTSGIIREELKCYWSYVIGPGGYICRPYTKFTEEWYNELHCRMDYYARALKDNPGDVIRNDNIWYPIRWTNILGDIFQPLSLKYHNKIIRDITVFPKCENYR